MWAIGCIMGEITDGQPLFPGESDIDQLYVIQKVLGPLTSTQKEEFSKNPRFIGLKFPEITRPETIEKKYIGKLSKTALQFMKGLISMDPNERMTADDALKHAYFDDIREDTIEKSGGSFNRSDNKSKSKLNIIPGNFSSYISPSAINAKFTRASQIHLRTLAPPIQTPTDIKKLGSRANETSASPVSNLYSRDYAISQAGTIDTKLDSKNYRNAASRDGSRTKTRTSPMVGDFNEFEVVTSFPNKEILKDKTTIDRQKSRELIHSRQSALLGSYLHEGLAGHSPANESLPTHGYRLAPSKPKKKSLVDDYRHEDELTASPRQRATISKNKIYKLEINHEETLSKFPSRQTISRGVLSRQCIFPKPSEPSIENEILPHHEVLNQLSARQLPNIHT